MWLSSWPRIAASRALSNIRLQCGLTTVAWPLASVGDMDSQHGCDSRVDKSNAVTDSWQSLNCAILFGWLGNKIGWACVHLC